MNFTLLKGFNVLCAALLLSTVMQAANLSENMVSHFIEEHSFQLILDLIAQDNSVILLARHIDEIRGQLDAIDSVVVLGAATTLEQHIRDTVYIPVVEPAATIPPNITSYEDFPPLEGTDGQAADLDLQGPWGNIGAGAAAVIAGTMVVGGSGH